MSLTDADFGYPAWRGFILWAFKQPEIRAAFTADTGRPWQPPPRNGLEAMIDKATGYSDSHAEAFVLWISEQWGIDNCPPNVASAIARSKEPAHDC